MIQKNRTLEGKNRTLGGEGGSKIIKNRRTSFMHVPLDIFAKPDPSNDLPPIIAHPLRFLEFPPSLFFSSSSTWNKKKH